MKTSQIFVKCAFESQFKAVKENYTGISMFDEEMVVFQLCFFFTSKTERKALGLSL